MEFLYNIILINKICWLPHPFKGRGKYFIRQNRVFSLLQKRSRYLFPLLSNLKGRFAPSLLFSSKINKCLGEEVSSTGDSNSSGWRRKEKRRRRSDSTLECNFHLSASDAPLPPSRLLLFFYNAAFDDTGWRRISVCALATRASLQN